MLKNAKNEHDSTVAQTYKFLRNLFDGDPQAQWDHICHEMHHCNAWAGLNGEKHKGKCPRTWASFKDCLELHKLTVFSTDAAERRKFFMDLKAPVDYQMSVRFTCRGTQQLTQAPFYAEELP